MIQPDYDLQASLRNANVKAKFHESQTRRRVPRMKITVKYGFSFREDVGLNQETLEVEQGPITVAQALDLIARRHPGMGKFVDVSSDEAQRRHLVVSANSKLARLADPLNDGDNISLLLPVSGGHGE